MKPRITIPTITVRPPWSSWIAAGLKTIETRTHARFRNLEGRSIAIHAGKSWDDDAFETAAANASPQVARMLGPTSFRSSMGKVVCLAHVRSVGFLFGSFPERYAALCETEKLFGLFLDRIACIDPPAPVRGKQGVWTWTPSDETIALRVRNHIEQTERNRR